MRARVYVTLKKEVLDPQGDAVSRALRKLGFDSVSEARVGKFIELEFADGNEPGQELEAMCKQLLANPVIEDYRFEVDHKKK